MAESQSFLDDTQKISLLDQSNMLASAIALPQQIQDIWHQAQSLSLKPISNINNIVVAAMGGSALGAHVIRSVFKSDLKVPLIIVNNYSLPAFVNERSLVILVSYSGTTEETLTALNDAVSKNAQVIVMATGEKLIDTAKTAHHPYFQFSVTHNPSDQPRMAIGYMVMGLIAILSHYEVLTIASDQIVQLVDFLTSNTDLYLGKTDSNPIKQLAYDLYDKIIFLVSSDHLSGAFHVINNQINENAKQITVELKLPELNHHYMEGLTFPKFVPNQGIFLFADSTLYHPRNRARLFITKEVVEEAGFTARTLIMQGTNKLTQAFECIQQGMFLNLYLSFLNSLNPAPIPKVDYFKKRLASVS